MLSLQVEAQIPPLSLHRSYLAARDYLKLLHDPEGSLCAEELQLKTGMTHLQPLGSPFNSLHRRAEAFLKTIGIDQIKRTCTNVISQVAPWTSVQEYMRTGEEIEVVLENKAEYLNYIECNYKDFNKVYCDGSKVKEENSTASGMYIEAEQKVICWKLRSDHTVMCAELFAIYQALRYISNEDTEMRTIIFTDSRSSIQLLSGTNQKYFNIAEKIRVLLQNVNKKRTVIVHWIKAHIGIIGNEIADRAAKMGHSQNKTVWLNIEREEMLNILRKEYVNYWNDYWKETANMTGKGLHLLKIRDNVKSSFNSKMKERNCDLQIKTWTCWSESIFI